MAFFGAVFGLFARIVHTASILRK